MFFHPRIDTLLIKSDLRGARLYTRHHYEQKLLEDTENQLELLDRPNGAQQPILNLAMPESHWDEVVGRSFILLQLLSVNTSLSTIYIVRDQEATHNDSMRDGEYRLVERAEDNLSKDKSIPPRLEEWQRLADRGVDLFNRQGSGGPPQPKFRVA